MSLRVIVDNRLRFGTAELPEWVVQRLKDAFTHRNPQHDKLKAMGKWPGKEPRFLTTWREDGSELSLPRGGTNRLRALLEEADIAPRFKLDVADGEEWDCPEHSLPNGGKLAQFQLDAVEAVLKRQNCIVRSPTGSGKSSIGINLISRLRRTTIVMVWTGALLKQWQDRLLAELPGLDPSNIGILGLGKRAELRPITLAMQQTVYSILQHDPELMDEIRRYFGLFIGDELQRFAAKTLVESVDPFTARYRVGMSADERRVDGKEFLTYDVFGGIEVDVDQQTLVDMNFVLDVEVRVVPTDFEAPWYVEEYTPEGNRNPLQHDFVRLLDAMVHDDERNRVVQDTIAMAAREGGTLVFCHRVEHCQMLDRACVAMGVQSGLMLGGASWSSTFDETKRRLMEGSTRVGIGTFQAIGQAIDVPAVSRGVVATPVGSNRQLFGQVRGRMCRANRGGSDSAVVFVVWDRRVTGAKALRNLLAWNRKVSVLAGGKWMDGKAYLKELRSGIPMF